MIEAIVNDRWTLDGVTRAAGMPMSLTEDEFADYSAKGFVRRAVPLPAETVPDVPGPGWVGRQRAPKTEPQADPAELQVQPTRTTERTRKAKPRA